MPFGASIGCVHGCRKASRTPLPSLLRRLHVGPVVEVVAAARRPERRPAVGMLGILDDDRPRLLVPVRRAVAGGLGRGRLAHHPVYVLRELVLALELGELPVVVLPSVAVGDLLRLGLDGTLQTLALRCRFLPGLLLLEGTLHLLPLLVERRLAWRFGRLPGSGGRLGDRWLTAP